MIARKDFQSAALTYRKALATVNSISSSELTANNDRADLLESMIAILNNLAMVHVNLCLWDLALENAIHSIGLIDAVASKSGGQVYKSILSIPKMTYTKFFIEWRVKSLYYQAQSRVELSLDLKKAITCLQQCLALTGGVDTLDASEKKVKKLIVVAKMKFDGEKNKEKAAARKMFAPAVDKSKKTAVSNVTSVRRGRSATNAVAPIANAVAPIANAMAPRPDTPPPCPIDEEDEEEWEEDEEEEEEDDPNDWGDEEDDGNEDLFDDDLQTFDDDNEGGEWKTGVEADEEEAWYDEHQEALILAGAMSVVGCVAYFAIKAMGGKR
jgi:hypothetical protein